MRMTLRLAEKVFHKQRYKEGTIMGLVAVAAKSLQ